MKRHYAVDRILDCYPGLDRQSVIQRLRRSTFVNPSKRYLYFEVPKAACTEMKRVLRRLAAAPPLELFADETRQTRRDMFVHARSNVPMPSLVDLGETVQREILESPGFLRMTVVRNPYSRLLSAWKSKVVFCEPQVGEVYLSIKGRLPEPGEQLSLSFAEFVAYVESACDLRTCNGHWRFQTDHTFFKAMNFSFVGKVETLGNALALLQAHIGLTGPIRLERGNESIPVDGGGYDEELARKVYSLYKQDFELLGYDEGSWADRARVRSTPSGNGQTVEDRLRGEIVERNLLISALYDDRARLQTELLSLRATLKRIPRQIVRAAVSRLASKNGPGDR
jgi:Sulfotransferase family